MSFRCDLAVLTEVRDGIRTSRRTRSATLSKKGSRRGENEDSVVASDESGTYALGDGLGGHDGGRLASTLATTTFVDEAVRHVRGELRDELAAVNAGVRAANDAVLAAVPDKKVGMGTTLVALRFSPSHRAAIVAHVGDSRAYRLRDGKLERLTDDHVLAQDGGSGRLLQALGAKDDVKPDVAVLAVEAGDIFVLCSDGLHRFLADARIGVIMREPLSLGERVENLLAAALSAGADDDATVVAVVVEDHPRPEKGRP